MEKSQLRYSFGMYKRRNESDANKRTSFYHQRGEQSRIETLFWINFLLES